MATTRRGSITFTLTAPNNTTTTVGTVPVSGNGTYTAPTVTATQVGTYVWHASYSGDGLNNGAIDNGVNESLTTVDASPSVTTSASETAGGVVGTSVLERLGHDLRRLQRHAAASPSP